MVYRGPKEGMQKKKLISLWVQWWEGLQGQNQSDLLSQDPRCWSDRGHIFLSAQSHYNTQSY